MHEIVTMYGKKKRIALSHFGPTKTQQHFKNDVNINQIIKKAMKSRGLPPAINPGYYGDFTSYTDYQNALDRIQNANDRFMEIPAEIRKRFDNNPGRFAAFLMDENNRTEAENLGLIVKKEVSKKEDIPPAAPLAT